MPAYDCETWQTTAIECEGLASSLELIVSAAMRLGHDRGSILIALHNAQACALGLCEPLDYHKPAEERMQAVRRLAALEYR